MESSLIELSKYRFQCACEDLKDAKILMDAGSFKSSVNRSYYAIFHMLRAVTALDYFDASKHSAVIAYVNRMYVKEGVFDKALPKMLDKHIDCGRMQIIRILKLFPRIWQKSR